MRLPIAVLALACATIVCHDESTNDKWPADLILDGLTKRIALMTNRLSTSQYSLNDTNSAQVFADALNVSYTYKQFFMVSDVSRLRLNNETLRFRRLDILLDLKGFFEAAALAVDAEAQPFGGRECGLLPAELRRFTAENYTIAPRLSVTLYALAHELDAIMDKVQKKQELTGGDVHRGIMDLCKSTGVDHAADRFKPVKTLVGPECRNRAADAGPIEKACLQIFIARYTNLSAQAVKLLQRSLYIYMYITMNVHAFCTPFIQMMYPNEPENDSARMVDALRTGLGLLRRLDVS
ncbi:hypothetical protein AAVH_24235 [Aphelenchoides avenae]|nr:hypothetical protein AAVH_24235 [Aphelenchus avenae]